MERQLNRPETTLPESSFENNWQPEIERRCPKCDSVFVTATDCESCGFQFSFKDMKHPTSERGFYGLKESFWQARGFSEKWLGLQNSRLFRGYIRKIHFRYNRLVDYLTSNPERDIHPVYRQEFMDLVDELLLYNADREQLFKKLEECLNFEKQSFLNEYYVLLGEDQTISAKNTYDLIEEILSFRLFGSIRIGSLLVSLMAGTSIIFLAIAVYRYCVQIGLV